MNQAKPAIAASCPTPGQTPSKPSYCHLGRKRGRAVKQGGKRGSSHAQYLGRPRNGESRRLFVCAGDAPWRWQRRRCEDWSEPRGDEGEFVGETTNNGRALPGARERSGVIDQKAAIVRYYSTRIDQWTRQSLPSPPAGAGVGTALGGGAILEGDGLSCASSGSSFSQSGIST